MRIKRNNKVCERGITRCEEVIEMKEARRGREVGRTWREEFFGKRKGGRLGRDEEGGGSTVLIAGQEDVC
jgi:hypothetical protein